MASPYLSAVALLEALNAGVEVVARPGRDIPGQAAATARPGAPGFSCSRKFVWFAAIAAKVPGCPHSHHGRIIRPALAGSQLPSRV